jgi:hypothetical protein
VPLLLENAEERAHGGGARRIRELVVDLRGGGVAAAIDDVHDLSFAAGELSGGGGGQWRSVEFREGPN